MPMRIPMDLTGKAPNKAYGLLLESVNFKLTDHKNLAKKIQFISSWGRKGATVLMREHRIDHKELPVEDEPYLEAVFVYSVCAEGDPDPLSEVLSSEVWGNRQLMFRESTKEYLDKIARQWAKEEKHEKATS